jgi:hypothetical protein
MLPADVDTDGTLCDAAIPQFCVIAGTTVTIGGTVDVHGGRPLVIVGTESIDITGTLDVASHTGDNAKTGPSATACNAPIAAQSHGGGAGGSLGTPGGAGGGDMPGQAGPLEVLTTKLHGGCKGGLGANAGGDPGDGGGAVYLVAGASITVDGAIDASGGGGHGSHQNGGGGGGAGSGGMIVFDTPHLAFGGNAQIYANGGGGGEGRGGMDGNDGKDPESPTAAATGGNGGTSGGDGGDGAIMVSPGGGGKNSSQNMQEGGGGGGGGTGIIKVFHATIPATGLVSPPIR